MIGTIGAVLVQSFAVKDRQLSFTGSNARNKFFFDDQVKKRCLRANLKLVEDTCT